MPEESRYLMEADGGGGGITLDDSDYLFDFKNPTAIGADGGIFRGALGGTVVLPPFTVAEMPVSPQTLGDIFGFAPNVGYGDIKDYELGGGLTSAITPAGGVRRETVTTPQDVLDYLRGSSAKKVGDQEAFMELAKNNQLDAEQIDYLRRSQAGISSQEEFQPQIPRPSGQGGIPLVLPIPGLDPATALAVTAAGLILSGGNIARLDPNKPVQSVIEAGKGIIGTGERAIDLATGETTLGEIWSQPSGGGGGGMGPTAPGASQQQLPAAGAIIGLAGSGQQPQQVGPISAPVQPGQELPSATLNVGTGGIFSGGQSATVKEPELVTSTSEPVGPRSGIFTPGVPQQATPQQPPISGGQTATAQEPQLVTSTSEPVGPRTGIFTPGVPKQPEPDPNRSYKSPTAIAEQTIVKTTPAVDLEPDVKPPVVTPRSGYQSATAAEPESRISRPPGLIAGDVTPTNKPPAGSGAATASEPQDQISRPPGLISGTVPTGTTTSTTTPATPIVINAPTTGYTLPQTGTQALRNLYTEAGTTLSSLASPMRQFQIGVDATGKPIYGTIPSADGQPLTLSQAIAQGYGGLAGGMREADVQNLYSAIGAATGRTPTAQTGYQSELNRAAAEQTAAANAALRLGNIMDAELLSARAQALRQQANPELFGAGGALPQYTQQAREQAMRDVAALRAAEAGQLTPEQIRNAQQAAREAYAARGQVFSEGAKAQEVLNRQQAIQQQQQIARQNLAQSMGQLGQGVAYQTANIFDPMAATLGAQYGMQSQNVGMNQALYNQAMGLTSGAGGYGFAQQMINPFTQYTQDVYGTNVNALNAAQIAAANRQAALEAAKMGQTGTYAQALGNLIASGGIGQIQSGITGGIQGLLNLLGGKWPTT